MAIEADNIKWVVACAVDDIDEEDVMRFDYVDSSYAINAE